MPAKPSSGHQITLLETAAEFLPEVLAACAQAQTSLWLETYIFAPDATGEQVMLALAAAAQRGVQVRVVLDGYGSSDFPDAWLAHWRAVGVGFFWFRRASGLAPWGRHRLRCLHRKLVLMDGYRAWVGGINIHNAQERPQQPPRLDYAVRVEGPLVRGVQHTMQRLWRRLAWLHMQGRSAQRVAASATPAWVGTVQASLVLRDNTLHRHAIERMYLQAIAQAQQDIVLANAYFLPGRHFRRALLAARARGVRVVLLLQGRVEYWWQHWATQALYPELLRAGVEIYEYHASFLHAKVAVVDGRWCTVGSSNIDPFSLLLAREANVAIWDAGLAQQLQHSLLRAMRLGAVRVEGPAVARGWCKQLLGRLFFAVMRGLVSSLALDRRHPDEPDRGL